MAKLIAHRGASFEAPENTISAIKKAVDLNVDYIEFDVHLSKDLIPVLSHDPYIKSHHKSTALIEEMEIDSIKQYDIGTWFHEKFYTEKVPTLAEVLEIPHANTHIMIELKRSGSDPYILAKKTLEVIEKSSFNKSTIIIGSFDAEILKFIQQLDVSQPVIAIMDTLENLNHFKLMDIRHFALWHRLLTKELINDLKIAGMKVWTYTVDDLSLIKELLSYHIDGVITNDPRKAQSLFLKY